MNIGRRSIKSYVCVGLFALLSFFGIVSDQAQATVSCDADYEIASGDTLSSIAQRVYGSSNRWLDIYEFSENAAKIGENPHILRVGSTIVLPPCDSDIPTEVPKTPRTASQQPSETDEFIPVIEIVTSNDWAPFTDTELPGRGMITQIVQAALADSGLPNDVDIDFIDDWDSHLNILLPKLKYDFGFPWFRPNCDSPELLSEAMRVRCDYVWSAPLYSVAIAFYAAVEDLSDPPPSSFDDLRDARICRPEGYFTFDLEANGLHDGDTIKLVRPPTVDGCFLALQRGEVDFVSMNRFTADRSIAKEKLVDIVEPLDSLVTVLDMHLVAHREHSSASITWMKAFNKGLIAIRKSGIYKKIISYHLQEHREEVGRLASK